jgi:hypothetical protein
MSVFWASEMIRRVRRARWMTAVPVIALGLLAAALCEARVSRTAAHDSTRFVKRVSISDQGIEITGDGNDKAVRHGARVSINSSGVQIESESGESLSIGSRGERRHGLRVQVDDSGLVRVFSDVEVRAGERVDGDVVAVFGSAKVDGEVTGDVVAVFGSVHLGPAASVGGDVVSVGGVLDQAPGATVHGESVSLGFMPVPWGAPGLNFLLGMVFVCWILSLAMGWILHLLFPTRMLRVAITATRSPAASFFLGFFSAPLMVIGVVLLIITVIGIPFALLLPLVYVFAMWAGQMAVTYLLGCRLLRRAPGEGMTIVPLLAGTLFVAVFFALATLLAGPAGALRTVALFFGLLGLLLVLGLSAIGTGAVLVSGFGSRPHDVEKHRAQSPVIGGGPSPETPPPAVVTPGGLTS